MRHYDGFLKGTTPAGGADEVDDAGSPRTPRRRQGDPRGCHPRRGSAFPTSRRGTCCARRARGRRGAGGGGRVDGESWSPTTSWRRWCAIGSARLEALGFHPRRVSADGEEARTRGGISTAAPRPGAEPDRGDAGPSGALRAAARARNAGRRTTWSARLRKSPGRAIGARGPLAARTNDADVIAHRLEVYRAQTEPLVAFYRERGVLSEVDGTGGAGRGRPGPLGAVRQRVVGALQ